MKWHPYPEEKPLPPAQRGGELYLVTLSDEAGTAFKVDVDLWLGREEAEGGPNWREYLDHYVLAWAYLPEPYQPEGKE